MTYSESIHFTYDGISSEEMGIMNVSLSNGLYEERFLPSRTIVEDKGMRDEPYVYGFEYSPIELPLTFAFKHRWNDELISRVLSWLYQPYFKPLVFSNNPSRIYYCAYVGDPQILHNGLKEGYVKITMRCNSPHSYSPVYYKDFLSTSNTLTSEHSVENKGEPTFPIITIYKQGDGDVSIINATDGGTETKVIQLLDGEIVTINCEDETVETNIQNLLRYDNFNDEYLRLVSGINRLLIKGTASIRLEYQSRRLG